MQQFNRESTYHNNVINESRLNPRNFWNAIKEIFSTKAGTKNSNSKTPQSNKKLADSFANYFSTAVRKLKTQSLRLKGFVCKSPCSSVLHTNKTFWFGYVSKVFITNFLKKIKMDLMNCHPECWKIIESISLLLSITSSTFHSRLFHQLGSRQSWCLFSNQEIKVNLKTADPSRCYQFSQSY